MVVAMLRCTSFAAILCATFCLGSATFGNSIHRRNDIAEFKLIGGRNRCEGRLVVRPISFPTGFGQACNPNTGTSEAKIICRQLRCPATWARRVNPAKYGFSSRSVSTYYGFGYSCDGSERFLAKCRRAGAFCAGDRARSAIAISCVKTTTATSKHGGHGYYGRRGYVRGSPGYRGYGRQGYGGYGHGRQGGRGNYGHGRGYYGYGRGNYGYGHGNGYGYGYGHRYGHGYYGKPGNKKPINGPSASGSGDPGIPGSGASGDFDSGSSSGDFDLGASGSSSGDFDLGASGSSSGDFDLGASGSSSGDFDLGAGSSSGNFDSGGSGSSGDFDMDGSAGNSDPGNSGDSESGDVDLGFF